MAGMRGRLRSELEGRGFRLRDPVGDFALLGLIQQAPFALPSSYLDLLRATNGGAGSLSGVGAFYLTAAEQVLAEHRGWGVDEQAAGHLLVATDGEGGFYLLDASPEGRVHLCRSVDLPEPGRWRLLTERFGELVSALGSAP